MKFAFILATIILAYVAGYVRGARQAKEQPQTIQFRINPSIPAAKPQLKDRA